ncbi:MAG TPA: PIN domain-containing protein [Thermoplasmata archaeon]|nr:PIN domain-containing protein [Thermoplasmata archaeon]
MTESDVLLDSWAWWEIFHDTKVGRAINRLYLESGKFHVHSSALSAGEIAAKLSAMGRGQSTLAVEESIRRFSQVHDVNLTLAVRGGQLRALLRAAEPDASLADGIVLATARDAGAGILSNDRAFRGLPELLKPELLEP